VSDPSDDGDCPSSEVLPPEASTPSRAFGAENRARLLREYLGDEQTTPADAWKQVYRLLLWIDRTTGLAHCYESDKSQPGRGWYARSIAFHVWLASQLGVTPKALAGDIDWMFRRAVVDLVRFQAARVAHLNESVAAQRAPYEHLDIPPAGEDSELEEILLTTLDPFLAVRIPGETLRQLIDEVRTYVGLENKRKNLVGEGFEDTLAALIRRLPAARGWRVDNRLLIGDIPNFQHQSGDLEKRKRVDLVLWNADAARRIIVTAKWSFRSDREEQFGTDFEAYVRLNRGRPFEHVLVTNEFDAARLSRACESIAANASLFTQVVHVQPQGVLAAYGDGGRGAARGLPALLTSGRLSSLEQWLNGTFT
jgi:hypothetical protein